MINHSLNKSDNDKSVPSKFDLLIVRDPDYGLCLAARNFNTGKVFALYNDIALAEKDLEIDLKLPKNFNIMDLTDITDVRRTKDGKQNYQFISEQKIDKFVLEQNLVLYGSKTV